MNIQFASDVKSGLKSKPKYLSSKYFYDEKGSKIFQDIMKMPEYYLTDCEFEIFQNNQDKLFDIFSENGKFDLVELGSGDGSKTKILLNNYYQRKADFSYVPIDISLSSIENLEFELNQEMPLLKLNPIAKDYFDALEAIQEGSDARKVVLFLGSNIGNFTYERAKEFLVLVASKLSSGDLLLIGFDMMKDPKIIMEAYNDSNGITKNFNLNLLDRINIEFDADFDLNNFSHHVLYNPISGATESFLISQKKHLVSIKTLQMVVEFEYAEPIKMELSQKYSIDMIEDLAESTGFEVKHNLFDCKSYFCDSIWELRKTKK